MQVVLAGGGTAGHIEPALNLADALRRRDPGVGITALGTEKGLEGRLVPARGYTLRMIPPVPLPRRPSAELLTLPGRVRDALARTEAILREVDADVVVGFGGYVALPAYLAARRTRTPLVIHEANARAGLANRLGARFTPHVAEAVAGSIRGATRIGIPLRRAIATLDRPAMRAEARAALGLAAEGPVLLVFGGSQGAQRINAAVAAALPELLGLGLQVLHAVGHANIDAVTERPPGYHPVAYLDRMDLAYAAADLVVSRSGALTCAELAAVGLPAIYVPFPIGNGEQRLNALPVVNAGGGLLIADEDLDAGTLVADVRALVQDPQRLARMSRAAAAHGVRDADDRLADMVQQAVAQAGGTGGGAVSAGQG
ncbi:MAG: undecaprenyldiphospho-muramoylpentapeptide beta-N-acetylglucosaminyltransferase [Candidatus Nanopelagicales bacterium]|jgi:UDP-N-acetylglucosamine--N-acetylmuramyl-(pentapeptide) pyrophosphoryl-undecaprenol N-acetylglucosamine transferase|nr:undecaprenyldiphospho-muramoylpentapeptide beta-N-acetylglucosaminyltransferase [Candidatus Nanopelagicales bacterium]